MLLLSALSDARRVAIGERGDVVPLAQSSDASAAERSAAALEKLVRRYLQTRSRKALRAVEKHCAGHIARVTIGSLALQHRDVPPAPAVPSRAPLPELLPPLPAWTRSLVYHLIVW